MSTHPAFVLALALLLPSSASAQTIRTVDGDTIIINGERIRIVNVDAPESWKPHCARELELGLTAKERLRVLLAGGVVTFQATGTDRYGHTLAHVYAGNVNVGERLIEEGHALSYVAGARAKAARIAVWCG